MWAAIIPAIIAAVAAIATGVTSYAQQKKTNDFNQAQYEDWKSYNSPENQMSRLTDAGLNKYLVNGANNTLSQPFQVGTNSGIAEALSGLGNASMQGGNSFMQFRQNQEQNAIQREKIENQREQIRLNSLGLQIKEKLANMNLKIGDYRAALLATQGKIANNQYDFLQRTLPYRVGNSFYDYLLNQQQYSYNEQMNPLKLRFYSPMQRAIINHYAAQDSHMKWYENFAMQKFLHDSRMDFKRFYDNQNQFELNNEYGRDRLNLSNRYFDLAEKKWYWSMFNDVIKNGISLLKPY